MESNIIKPYELKREDLEHIETHTEAVERITGLSFDSDAGTEALRRKVAGLVFEAAFIERVTGEYPDYVKGDDGGVDLTLNGRPYDVKCCSLPSSDSWFVPLSQYRKRENGVRAAFLCVTACPSFVNTEDLPEVGSLFFLRGSIRFGAVSRCPKVKTSGDMRSKGSLSFRISPNQLQKRLA